MEVLFSSLMMPLDIEGEIAKYNKRPVGKYNTYIQLAAIKGLLECGADVSVVNKLHVESYPKNYAKMKVAKYSFNISGCNQTYGVGFLNLPIINKLCFFNHMKASVDDWAKKTKGDARTLICYPVTSYNLDLLKYVKKKYPDVKTSIIVPDLPRFMRMGEDQSVVRRLYLQRMDKKIRNVRAFVDRWFLFSKHMADYIGCEKNYTVVEGFHREMDFRDGGDAGRGEEIKLYYAGGISKSYGLVDLIDAFEMIENDNLRLVLCGAGDAEEYVKLAAEKDKRIEFHGTVPYEKANALLIEADIVVNPRACGKHEFTKYSFPSKTIEALAFGKPLISFHLEGIPEEYDEHIFYVDGEGPEGLAKTISTVAALSKTELCDRGERGRKFINENKTGKKQAEKLLRALFHEES